MNLEPLTIAGRLDDVTQLMDYVAWAAAAAGLDEQATYRLCLAVDEIATNIVTYAYEQAGREGDLTVWADTSDTDLRVTLQDWGDPFDPREMAPPDDLHKPPDQRRNGGLGIFLAMWGVDEFHYKREGSHNQSTFVVHLRPDQSSHG